MSQIWKDMNFTGKYCVVFGSASTLLGMIVVLWDKLQMMDGLGACCVAVGLHYLTIAQYDERCNKNYVKPVKVKVNDEHHEIGS